MSVAHSLKETCGCRPLNELALVTWGSIHASRSLSLSRSRSPQMSQSPHTTAYLGEPQRLFSGTLSCWHRPASTVGACIGHFTAPNASTKGYHGLTGYHNITSHLKHIMPQLSRVCKDTSRRESWYAHLAWGQRSVAIDRYAFRLREAAGRATS
jgi:hypothetical protein